jgi:hypothetical protein
MPRFHAWRGPVGGSGFMSIVCRETDSLPL